MDNNRVDVYVSEGRLIGIVEEAIYGGRYVAFRGIPYAKPPIDKLRFKDPLPPEPWLGGRDASKHGNVAVQFDVIKKKMVGDEDCLYLNVYTPDIIKKRTVMVWIHGGGFSVGSGDADLYGPDFIVRKDVVLVTLNYRLGALGFLNLNDKVATGNQGLKDVVMALRWVQRNISQFGGDPENVTIFGESAGGAIVHYLTLSPLATGLFHKAISQSGVATNPWAFTDESINEATNKGFQLAKKLGKTTSDPKVAYEFLKTIDAIKLVETTYKHFTKETDPLNHIVIFTPTLDSESPDPFFPEHPLTLMHRGVKVPFLLGNTSCEGSFFICNNLFGRISKEALKKVDSDFKSTITPRVLSTLPKIPITVEELRFLYFGNKAISEETLMNYADFLGDALFCRGTMEVVDVQMNSDYAPTYLYKFSYDSETCVAKKIFGVTLPGVPHGEDLFYLFYPYMMKDNDVPPPEFNSEDFKAIDYLTQLWTDFAKTGDPTPAITDLTPIKWAPLKRGDVYDYLNIDVEPRMESICKGEHRTDWKNMKNKL